ncbi:MAG: hypothetical protein IKU62_08440 [Ruminiclostridium sp.]|nr:hypothetical protein [Ruminiclostridium sp.]
MNELKWGDEYRTTWVCVDGYENGVLQGRFYHLGRPEGETFHSLSQYLLRMEDLLNEIDRPQAYTTARSFNPGTGPGTEKPDVTLEKKGRLATFQVRVLFRQNASWQGEVIWNDRRKVQFFRSVLELVHLMDSALQTEVVA